jgi:hypothetical protein
MNKMHTPSTKEHNKDTIFTSQIQTIFHYLKEHVCTASMLSNATGIPQKNICRYKRDLEQAGRLWEIEKKACQLTGFKAYYLTTDETKALKSNQLKLL